MKKSKRNNQSGQTTQTLAQLSVATIKEQSKQQLAILKGAADKTEMKKRAQQSEFRRLYLVKRLSCERCQCYISREVYEKIRCFLPVVAPGLPITTYIDSVLRCHLNNHKEQINDLYTNNLKMPF